MQVQVKKSFYQSFGGINFIEEDIRKINFDPLVTQTLGSRSLLAQYSYGDLLKAIYELHWKIKLSGSLSCLIIAKQKYAAWKNHCLAKKHLAALYAYRRKLSNEQATIFDNNGYRYSAIVTSDTKATALDVIEFYTINGY